MEKPTEILLKEHENILKIADSLARECDLVEKGKELDKTFFKEVIGFINGYADKFHHAKEEDILFKEFCKKSTEVHCNPVEQMLYEHNLGRDFVKGMERGLGENDKSKVVKNARNYAELLKEHTFKEDNILYPMVDEVLDQKVQKSILEKFKKISTTKKKEIERFERFAKKVARR